jgi:hypothetical protein
MLLAPPAGVSPTERRKSFEKCDWSTCTTEGSAMIQNGTRQQSRQYLTTCSISERLGIPISRRVRSSNFDKAATDFLISRSFRQYARNDRMAFFNEASQCQPCRYASGPVTRPSGLTLRVRDEAQVSCSCSPEVEPEFDRRAAVSGSFIDMGEREFSKTQYASCSWASPTWVAILM